MRYFWRLGKEIANPKIENQLKRIHLYMYMSFDTLYLELEGSIYTKTFFQHALHYRCVSWETFHFFNLLNTNPVRMLHIYLQDVDSVCAIVEYMRSLLHPATNAPSSCCFQRDGKHLMQNELWKFVDGRFGKRPLHIWRSSISKVCHQKLRTIVAATTHFILTWTSPQK